MAIRKIKLMAVVFLLALSCGTVNAGNGSGNEPPRNDDPTPPGNGSGNEPPAGTTDKENGILCQILPLFCEVGTQGNGSGNEPPAK